MTSLKDKLAKMREGWNSKLDDLHQKKEEAKRLNRKAVVEEAKVAQLPKNWESKRRRLEWEEEDEEFKQQCLEKGQNPKEMKLLEVSADVAGRLSSRDRRRQYPSDTPYFGREEASYKKYLRLTRQLKPDKVAYEKEKKALKECFYPTADTLGLTQRKDTKEGIERMMQDMEQQIESRKTFRRRRVHDDEAGIDYINEKNKRFNETLERQYGKYTEEIKQNLERGTAV